MSKDLESLYKQYGPAVLRFAWGLCGDRARAEDILSETFVRVATRAIHIETQTALGFLLAVAHNVFVDDWRRQVRERPLPDGLPAPRVDVEGQLDDRRRLEKLNDALRSLPVGNRAALLLRVDHELTYAEIGRMLHISEGAAKVRVHRARVMLVEAVKTQRGNT